MGYIFLLRTKYQDSTKKIVITSFIHHLRQVVSNEVPPQTRRKEGGNVNKKKTVPKRLLDQPYLFKTSMLSAIWLISNFDQLSIDSSEDENIVRNLTSIKRVLTHKHSFAFKESYRKFFHLTKSNFDLDTSLNQGL